MYNTSATNIYGLSKLQYIHMHLCIIESFEITVCQNANNFEMFHNITIWLFGDGSQKKLSKLLVIFYELYTHIYVCISHNEIVTSQVLLIRIQLNHESASACDSTLYVMFNCKWYNIFSNRYSHASRSTNHSLLLKKFLLRVESTLYDLTITHFLHKIVGIWDVKWDVHEL